MKLAIDASNIRAGGGVTHLSQILHALGGKLPEGYESITVFGGQETLSKLPKIFGLNLVEVPLLKRTIFFRIFWQQFILPILSKNFDALFSPGGTGSFCFSKPFITMSQNMLPFEKKERSRYPFFSWMRLKLSILKFVQSKSFQRARGIIFLSEYASRFISKGLRLSEKNYPIIPHGVEARFFMNPRTQRDFSEFTNQKPAKILYVSIVDMYKHQWNVVEAVSRLILKGIPIELTLIGPSYSLALEKLNLTIEHLDPNRQFVRYLGAVPFDKLHEHYKNSDLFIFASSCENLPNILIEAMAAGLPILSSNRGPMPEVLKDCGGYFNPEDVEDIAQNMEKALSSKTQRSEWAQKAYDEGKRYSWKICAEKTFTYIQKVAEAHNEI